MLLNFILFILKKFPEAIKTLTRRNIFFLSYSSMGEFWKYFLCWTLARSVLEIIVAGESKAHIFIHCRQEFLQGVLSLANISWASFESGFNGGPLALISVSPSCIFLRGYVLIIPLQGKE